MTFTLGRVHGSTQWRLVYGPNNSRKQHRDFIKERRFKADDRTYAEIVQVTNVKFRKKFSDNLLDPDSSSSSSSTAASNTSSSSSTVASVTSSSSTAASNSSSSSSSSVNSSSSSSNN